jgi:hypothetical protein
MMKKLESKGYYIAKSMIYSFPVTVNGVKLRNSGMDM